MARRLRTPRNRVQADHDECNQQVVSLAARNEGLGHFVTGVAVSLAAMRFDTK